MVLFLTLLWLPEPGHNTHKLNKVSPLAPGFCCTPASYSESKKFWRCQSRLSVGWAASGSQQHIRQDREILKPLIDIVVFPGTQDLAFRGHDEGKDFVNKGNYLEMLEFLFEYHNPLCCHLDTATVFIGTSNKTENNLIQSVADVMTKAMKDEQPYKHTNTTWWAKPDGFIFLLFRGMHPYVKWCSFPSSQSLSVTSVNKMEEGGDEKRLLEHPPPPPPSLYVCVCVCVCVCVHVCTNHHTIFS